MRANCSAIIGGKYSRLVRQSVAVLLLRERAQQQISCTPPAALFGSAINPRVWGLGCNTQTAQGAAAARTATPRRPTPNAHCPALEARERGVPLGCVCCVGSPGVRVLCVGRCACGFKWVCKLQMHNAPTHTPHPLGGATKVLGV